MTVPFPVDTIEHSTHKTYLDSIGRPRITIKKRMCVEKHEQDVYVRFYLSLAADLVCDQPRLILPTVLVVQVTYTYPFAAQFQKVFTVGIATAVMFAVFALAKRLDVRISKVPQVAVVA